MRMGRRAQLGVAAAGAAEDDQLSSVWVKCVEVGSREVGVEALRPPVLAHGGQLEQVGAVAVAEEAEEGAPPLRVLALERQQGQQRERGRDDWR